MVQWGQLWKIIIDSQSLIQTFTLNIIINCYY